MRNKSRAFTLIELLVVVLIIGILAAVAVPQYQKAVLKSRTLQGLVRLRALDQAQIEYKLANGSYTNDLTVLSIPAKQTACSISGTLVYCVIYNSLSKNEIIFEWQGDHTARRWICLAKESSAAANSICANQQKEWNSTVATTTADGHIYYRSLDMP